VAKTVKPTAPPPADKPKPKSTLLVETWPVDKPVPYPKNARVIPESAVDLVAKSLREFGWRQPIVVDEQGVIVVGHTRLKAAVKLGLKSVPVHVMRGVPQDKVDAYRLMDNRANQETMWDNDVLAEELSELRATGYDLANTGFSAAELQAHLEGMETTKDLEAVAGKGPASEAEDEPPPPPPDVKPKGAITCPRCRKHFTPESH